MKNIITFLSIFLLGALALGSCIEDGFSTSPSDQPVFSADTVDMGVLFTDEPSPTSRFKVYNPHSKSLLISSVRIVGDNAGCYRVNVDGMSGAAFSDVEIRGKDSVFVLVEATLPPNSSGKPMTVDAKLEFMTNGVASEVVLRACGQDVRRLREYVVESDEIFDAALPYQIYDSLVVAEGATLTLAHGATLYFHDKASMIVRGTLLAEGTAEAPVNMRNTERGLAIEGDGAGGEPSLSMLNCRLHNSAGTVLEAVHSSVEAVGCEFAEGGAGLVALHGGSHEFRYCTFANNYLFSAVSGPAVALSHVSADAKTGFDDGSGLPYIEARISNSVIYGIGADISHGDLTGTCVSVHRCLMRSKGSDDDNFTDCLWEADPLFYTERSEYVFDYRLRPESPAIGAADPAISAPADFYGHARGSVPDLGAYVFEAP